MQFKIRNKNIMKTDYVDLQETIFLMLVSLIISFLVVFSFTSLTPFKDLIINDDLTVSVLIFIIIATCVVYGLSIIILIILCNIINKRRFNTENYVEKVKNTLNESYIDKNDNEKVYLLHELIKKHGIDYSTYNQENDLYLELNLNLDNNKYEKFNKNNYDNDRLDILNNIINHKKIEDNQAIEFFDQYISLYSKPKVRSIEERNKLKQKIENKNL